jgi:hypothetical protein
MAKKKRRRPSRRQASLKQMSIQIARCVIWVIRLICALLEVWSSPRMTSCSFIRRMEVLKLQIRAVLVFVRPFCLHLVNMSATKTYPLDQSPLYQLESKRELANLLFLNLPALQLLANRTDNYRSREVVHAGKVRHLEVPKPALERIQKRLFRLLERIEKPDYLHSGRKQRSYITNAQVHVGRVPLIKLDIQKFYASVSVARVYRLFRNTANCSPDVASLLAKLCTAKGHLPIGSRVSQLLAFFSAKPMFDELHTHALEHGVRGTCYVDDLIWSGTNATPRFLWRAKQIVHRHGFTYHKDRVHAADQPKVVTGVQIVGDQIKARPCRDQELWIAVKTLDKPDVVAGLKEIDSLVGKASASAQIEERFNRQVRQLRARKIAMLQEQP